MKINVLLAKLIARVYHAGDTDRAGVDYYKGHLTNVAKAVKAKGHDPTVIAVAYLHDVVEDTAATVGMLRKLFGNEIADAVAVLTRAPGEPYMDYVMKVKKSGNAIARAVKIADLEDHLVDTTAIPDGLIKRYKKALRLIA